MSHRGKKGADEALLMALACGATVENAARTSGISVRTAHRRLSAPDFQHRLQDVRGDMVQRAAGLLTAAAMEAIKTLMSLQESSNPGAVRLGAARTILEFGLKLRESAELAARLTTLEERLGIRTDGVAA
jgi:hypothetical protein